MLPQRRPRMRSRSNIGAVAPVPRACSRLAGHDADLVLAGGCLRRTGIRPEACCQMGVRHHDSLIMVQKKSRVLGARTRVPRVLRALRTHTPSSRRSGGIISDMLFTASAVRSTCAKQRQSVRCSGKLQREVDDVLTARGCPPGIRSECSARHAPTMALSHSTASRPSSTVGWRERPLPQKKV